MFNKKKCPRCNNKIKESYDFCPHCGNPSKSQKEDWGMLGKTDIIPNFQQNSDPFSNMFGGGMLGKMLGSTMKMLEKEIQREMSNSQKNPRTHFEMYVNGKRVDPKNIKVTRQPMQQIENNNIKEKFKGKIFSKEKQEKFAEFSKEEPTTNIRRLSNKIIYEINIPGVTSIEDISIVKINQGIEIKAISKNKSYYKTIPINLPISAYSLEKNLLILELEAKN